MPKVTTQSITTVSLGFSELAPGITAILAAARPGDVGLSQPPRRQGKEMRDGLSRMLQLHLALTRVQVDGLVRPLVKNLPPLGGDGLPAYRVRITDEGISVFWTA